MVNVAAFSLNRLQKKKKKKKLGCIEMQSEAVSVTLSSTPRKKKKQFTNFA